MGWSGKVGKSFLFASIMWRTIVQMLVPLAGKTSWLFLHHTSWNLCALQAGQQMDTEIGQGEGKDIKRGEQNKI